MYETEAGVTTDEAQEYARTELPGVKADAVLRSAERIVRSVATPPSSEPSEYYDAARDAEFAVFELQATDPGHYYWKELDGVTVRYADPVDRRRAEEVARESMAGWVTKRSGIISSVATDRG